MVCQVLNEILLFDRPTTSLANARFNSFIAGLSNIDLSLTVDVAVVGDKSEDEAAAHEQVIDKSENPPELGEHAEGPQRGYGGEVPHKHARSEH